MSFNAKENSEDSGEPRELYWFMRGSEQWAYAAGTEEVTVASITYVPTAGISRSSIRNGRERARNQITVEVPRDLGIAQQFVGVPNIEPVWLYIYKIHEGEVDYRITWQGRIRFVEFKGAVASIVLDDIAGSTKKGALRHLFQNQCNHFTYDGGCTLLEANYSVFNVPITTQVDNVITVNDSQAAGYYQAGQVKRANGDRRMVVTDTKAGSTHTLTLLTPFENLPDGEEVTLIGGACRHTFDTCKTTKESDGTVVNNAENFGGFPKVPRKNPFKSIT